MSPSSLNRPVRPPPLLGSSGPSTSLRLALGSDAGPSSEDDNHARPPVPRTRSQSSFGRVLSPLRRPTTSPTPPPSAAPAAAAGPSHSSPSARSSSASFSTLSSHPSTPSPARFVDSCMPSSTRDDASSTRSGGVLLDDLASESSSNAQLPFHSRPFSKWDASLIDEDGPHITSVPPIRSTYMPPSTEGEDDSDDVLRGQPSNGARPPTSRKDSVNSTVKSKTSSSSFSASRSLSTDSFHRRPPGGKARDGSYLARLAENDVGPTVVSPSLAKSASVQPQGRIPYGVKGTSEVREMEILLLESIRWGVLGGDYTFVKLQDGQAEPERVLDIGCGTGYWCIAQAGRWKTSHFVGFDYSRNQIDLGSCARDQRRRAGDRLMAGEPERVPLTDWSDLSRRIEWVQGDFLGMLPFDSGSFDVVRISFVNLGVPELSWQTVLEECTRVLKKGTGVLEILETSSDLPSELPLTPPPSPILSTQATVLPRQRMGSLSAAASLAPVSTSQHSRSVSTQRPRIPSSRKERYENLLRQHMIQPLPNISIRSALLMQTGMSKSKEVFSKTYRRSVGSCARDTHGKPSLSGDEHDVAPGFLGAATGVWVESTFPSTTSPVMPVFPTLHDTITQTLCSDLAGQGIEWCEPDRFPSDLQSTKRGKRRSLMPPKSPPPARDELDLGTLSLHAWVGTKSAGRAL